MRVLAKCLRGSALHSFLTCSYHVSLHEKGKSGDPKRLDALRTCGRSPLLPLNFFNLWEGFAAAGTGFSFINNRVAPVRFGYGLGVERFERFRFSVPAVPLQKRFLCVLVQFNRKERFRFRFRFLENGSGGSGSAFGFGKNGSDGSGFRFRFGS